jgi:hypothetical protein
LPGANAGVVFGFAGFPTGVTSGVYSNSYVLSATQETELLTGQWYVNIHTVATPGGEIRGQLQQSSPVITSFAPLSSTAGTSIIITGTNFNAVAANNLVYFGAKKATVTSGTTQSLTVTAPAGATYQPISVLDIATGLTGYSSIPFITTFTNPTGTGIPANFFKPKVDFVCGTSPHAVAMGDIDGDNKPELVLANSNSNTLSVLRNTATLSIIDVASFASKVDFASGTFTEHVAIADINGDGKRDLVVVNNNNLSVLRNTATLGTIDVASFAAKVDFDLVFTGPVFVAIGDVDGDGKPDLVAANSGSNNVAILRNTSTAGSISFAAKVSFATGFTPFSVAIGDVDGDGKPDLVVPNAAVGANSVSVLRNTSITGVVSFAAKVDFTTGATPRSVAIADVDGDGKSDLVAANSAVAATTLSVLRNTSTPGIIDLGSFAAKVDFATGAAPRSVAVADVDGDARPDLVVANINSTSISVLRNTSTPGIIDVASFAAKVDFATGAGPYAVAIADMDGDGIPEAATTNGSINTVSVFQIDFTAVPVTLTNVKAYQKNTGVQVEWETQQEVNINRYEVERSENAQQFIKLGTVFANGNSSVVKKYYLFDPNPLNGINFYRIKIIEAGHQTYSKTLKVNISHSGATQISIYPNPVKGNTLVLQINNLQKGNYTLTLTNKHGQQITTKKMAHAGGSATETMKPLKEMATGVYQLRLTGEGINLITQVIKN